MQREEIYKVIDKERSYQDSVWGGNSHDAYHTVGDWLIYMQHYMDRAKVKHATAFKSDNDTLNELRKVVALGIACFEQAGVPDRDNFTVIDLKDADGR